MSMVDGSRGSNAVVFGQGQNNQANNNPGVTGAKDSGSFWFKSSMTTGILGGGLGFATGMVSAMTLGIGALGVGAVAGTGYLGIAVSSYREGLPNDPGFDYAIADKRGELGDLVQDGAQSPHGPTSQAMTSIMNVLTDQSLDVGRGGDDLGHDLQTLSTAFGCGAHFVVADGGAMFRDMQQSGDFTTRSSSHYGKTGQLGMDLADPPGGHLLVGRTNTGDTFFQLEGHGTGGSMSLDGFKQSANHFGDFLKHSFSSDSYVQITHLGCIEGSEKDHNQITLTPRLLEVVIEN